MLIFKKNKLKMSLVEDYIVIILAKNFFNNEFDFSSLSNQDKEMLKQNRKIVENLNNVYQNMFKQLKMDDLSLLILNKEIKESNSWYIHEKQNKFTSLPLTIRKITEKINTIEVSLHEKQKVLKL